MQIRGTKLKLNDMLSFIELRRSLRIDDIIMYCNVIGGHTAELGWMLAISSS